MKMRVRVSSGLQKIKDMNKEEFKEWLRNETCFLVGVLMMTMKMKLVMNCV